MSVPPLIVAPVSKRRIEIEYLASVQPITLIAAPRGKSAYQLWLDAGNVGTVEDFLGAILQEVSQAELDAEASARSAADTAEASARASADTALAQSIADEAAARIAAVAAEAAARIADIAAEASARTAADALKLDKVGGTITGNLGVALKLTLGGDANTYLQESGGLISWAEAVEFRRDDPLLNQMAEAFGLGGDQVDALFAAAATL